MTSLRFKLIGAAMSVGALVSAPVGGGAMAAAVTDCAAITSIASWLASGTCLIGDKAFLIDAERTDVGVGLPVAFSSDAGAGTHSVTFSPDSFRPGVVAYTVVVVDPDREIWKIAIDSEGFGALDRLAFKDIRESFDGTVIATLSEGGALPSEALVVGSAFHITDRFGMESATVLETVTNVFFQRDIDVPVPVPATAVLFGAGLVGLIASRRRAA